MPRVPRLCTSRNWLVITDLVTQAVLILSGDANDRSAGVLKRWA